MNIFLHNLHIFEQKEKERRGAPSLFSIFRFWKVLSQEGQMSEELLDTAGASETRSLRVSSLPGTQPVPEAEGLSREVRLLLPLCLPMRLQAKLSARPCPHLCFPVFIS